MLNALLGKTLKLPGALGAWTRPGVARVDGDREVAPELVVVMAESRDPPAASLYRCAPGNLWATALLGLAMSIAIDLSNPAQVPTAWLLMLMLVTTGRAIHAVYWRRAKLPPNSVTLTRQYAIGLCVNAVLWGVLPLISFGDMDLAGRVTVMLATVGVASADARVLSAMPRNASLQGALMTVPGILWLLASGHRVDNAIGVMVAVLLAIAAATIHASYGARKAALQLAEENRRLSLTEAESRRQIDRMTHESNESRSLMEHAQLGLEQRIDERTAALEDRSRDLQRQAVTDSLTGLPNRKGINEHLIELLAPMQALNSKTELALLFLDLDHFKDVNDQLGHLAGDEVLCLVAERLQETLPRSAFSARWGGDEFIVVLPGMGRKVEQVRLMAEQIRAALCLPMQLVDGVVRTGCSIGIALAPLHGRTPEALIIAADHAVYAAKTDGIGRVRVFDVALAKKAGREHQIAQALPGALELGQLEVAYQPIVASADGHATHVEALARWWHPKWGGVSPGEFIPVAEASGHIHTLGRWVLRQACLDAARWPGSNPPKVSVNVSALQVASGRLVAQVREALAAAKLPAQRLMIELTESLPMAGRENVAKTLTDLREMGVTLAIDDFGTGYSSLSSLMKQPLSLVKVDRSFVQDVPGEGELLIKATVDVARCFGLEVVAEGVETAAQQTRLIALGVSYMQGYLFGRPMPNAEFVAWLGLRDGTTERFALRTLTLVN
jgi:diguanylate cyclase (GGDEF)-like protein